MKLAILDTDPDGVVTVWAMLDDDGLTPDPRQRTESFVIGEGTTRAAAITDAQRDLEDALEQLAAFDTRPVADGAR